MCRAPSPGAAESQARVSSHAPLHVLGLLGRAVLRAEAGVRRGAKGEENFSHGRAFEDRVVKGGREESLPKAGAGAHPGAGNTGAAGFFREDHGGDTVAYAAELAEEGVLYFLQVRGESSIQILQQIRGPCLRCIVGDGLNDKGLVLPQGLGKTAPHHSG